MMQMTMHRWRLVAAAGVAAVISLAGCGGPQPASAEKAKADAGQPPAKPAPKLPEARPGGAENCAGFTAADASALLGVPADQISVKIEESYSGFWMCSYSTAKPDKSLNFSVTIARDEQTAVSDMQQYRSNLEIAAETPEHKDNLPAGAYSEIVPLGDENVWTDVNGTLTVRSGAVSFQIQAPPGKMAQVKAAHAILGKLKPAA